MSTTGSTSDGNVRIERDSMGPMEVPNDALYGASTMRAVLNFPISDLRFPRSFIRALGLVKLAAAKTNVSLGLLDKKTGDAVAAAVRSPAKYSAVSKRVKAGGTIASPTVPAAALLLDGGAPPVQEQAGLPWMLIAGGLFSLGCAVGGFFLLRKKS